MLRQILFAVATVVSLVEGVARTSPPSGAIVVAKSGGSFTTLQAAVNSISTTSTTARIIFIQPGTYNEQVAVPALAGKLTIYGYTANDQDYTKNQVTITQSKGADEAGNNDASGTLRVRAANFAAYNLNVINSRGSGIQAIAISAQGGNQGFYGCKFIGYQDTVLANEGVQVYDKCYIEGATDFIFGQRAIAWFNKNTIAISGKGYVTANGRDSSSNPSYYVINGGSISVKSGVTLAAGSTYLGRPWRNYSRVVVQNVALSAVVNSAGWVQWGSSDPRTDNVFYREFGNTGTGASGTRASFSSKLSSAVTLGGVIGSTSWVDMTYYNGAAVVSSTFVATTTATTTTSRSTTAVTTSISTTLRTTTTSAAPTTTSASSGGCTVEKWGKCGGFEYTGCTSCVAGSVCTFSSEFYSQCL